MELTPEEKASEEKKKEVEFVRDSILNPKQPPVGEVLEEIEKEQIAHSEIGCDCNFCKSTKRQRPVITTTIIREPERAKIVTTRDIPRINLNKERENREQERTKRQKNETEKN